MALLQSELQALRFHLGFNQELISAQAYLWDGVTQTLEQIVAVYLQSGWLAHTPTAVVASPLPSPPTTVTLTMNEGVSGVYNNVAVAFNVGDTIVVDQGIQQEYSFVQVVTQPNQIQCALQNAHSGTYPVTVEGGETIIRKCLTRLLRIELEMDAYRKAAGVSAAGGPTGVKFYASNGSQKSRWGELQEMYKFWRAELALSVGIGYPRSKMGGGGFSMEAC